MGFFPYSTQTRQIKISPTAFCRANRRVANNSTYTVSDYCMVSAFYKIEQFTASTLFTGTSTLYTNTSTLYTNTSTSDIGNCHVVIEDWSSKIGYRHMTRPPGPPYRSDLNPTNCSHRRTSIQWRTSVQ